MSQARQCGSGQLLQFFDGEAGDAPAVRLERGQVAECLGGFEAGEGIGLAGDGEVGLTNNWARTSPIN